MAPEVFRSIQNHARSVSASSQQLAQGDVLYHVKWDGYDDPKDTTWEPEENLS